MPGSCLAAMARWYRTTDPATPAADAIFCVAMPRLYISTHSGSGAMRLVWVIHLPVSSPQGSSLDRPACFSSAIRSRRNTMTRTRAYTASPASTIVEIAYRTPRELLRAVRKESALARDVGANVGGLGFVQHPPRTSDGLGISYEDNPGRPSPVDAHRYSRVPERVRQVHMWPRL